MEGNGRRWSRSIAAAVGAATFLAVAGVAAARLTSDSATTTIDPQQNGTATAKCDSGSAAVAGGFAAPGFDPSASTGPANLTFASNRPASGKWVASAHNYNSPTPPPDKAEPGAGPLLAYAYCDKSDPSVTVRSATTTVAGAGHATLTPTCPTGREAISGGFQSDAPTPGTGEFTNFAYTSKRAGDQAWKIAVLNLDPSSHTVTAFAYCEKHAPKLVSRSAQATVSLQEAAITAKCPEGSKAFSGGYKSTFSGSGTTADTSLAFTSKRAGGESWKVSTIAVIIGETTAPTEKAIVYCTT